MQPSEQQSPVKGSVKAVEPVGMSPIIGIPITSNRVEPMAIKKSKNLPFIIFSVSLLLTLCVWIAITHTNLFAGISKYWSEIRRSSNGTYGSINGPLILGQLTIFVGLPYLLAIVLLIIGTVKKNFLRYIALMFAFALTIFFGNYLSNYGRTTIEREASYKNGGGYYSKVEQATIQKNFEASKSHYYITPDTISLSDNDIYTLQTRTYTGDNLTSNKLTSIYSKNGTGKEYIKISEEVLQFNDTFQNRGKCMTNQKSCSEVTAHTEYGDLGCITLSAAGLNCTLYTNNATKIRFDGAVSTVKQMTDVISQFKHVKSKDIVLYAK